MKFERNMSWMPYNYTNFWVKLCDSLLKSQLNYETFLKNTDQINENVATRILFSLIED